jgi:hypothetical protein
MPLFFINPALLQAVQHTDFRDDINWMEMPLPFEHGVFVLPRGGLKHELDGDAAFIFWSRCRKGNHLPVVPGIPIMQMTEDNFSIVTICPEHGVWYDSHLTATMRPTLKLNNLFYRTADEPMPKIRKNTQWDEDADPVKDADFIESLGTIVFGTLLAMTARPTLLTKAKLLKSVTRADQCKKEFWTPNIIGEGYAPKHVVSTHASGNGTHARPRMHWRRGHFRNQAYGPGMKEHHVIWMEPMLIAAGDTL